MDLNITSEKNNPLLKRLELGFEINQKTTPLRKEIVEALSSLKNVKKELVIISHVVPVYGAGKLVGEANIYENGEALKKTEKKYLIERHFGKQEKPKEEKAEKAPEAQKTGEKKAEGKKEEKTVEKK